MLWNRAERANPASLVALVAVALAALLLQAAPDSESLPSTSGVARPLQVPQVPILFEEHVGQPGDSTRYLADVGGLTLVLGVGGAEIVPAGDVSGTLTVPHAGAPAGELPAAAIVNRYVGSDSSGWRTGLATYQRIVYRGAFPGIDVVYHAGEGVLEIDYAVAPGANPSTIQMGFEGAEAVELTDSGGLAVISGSHTLRVGAPEAYQERGGSRVPVKSAFRVLASGAVGVDVGEYDETQVLVIDPTLEYGTYLGGTLADRARGVDVDGEGNIYVALTSSSNDFPDAGATVGVSDVLVAKLDPTVDGPNSLVYVTRLGGIASDVANDLVVDEAGNAYVTGLASNQFPIERGFQPLPAGGLEVFAAKLDAAGELSYSTYIGGSESENFFTGSISSLTSPSAIDLDAGGMMLVSGSTPSADFPLKNEYQGTLNGTNPFLCQSDPFAKCSDAFVTKIDPSASGPNSLVYSTLVGGSESEVATGVAAGPGGTIFITGYSQSAGYPTTDDAFQESLAGGECGEVVDCPDAILSQLDPNETGEAQLKYSTFLGGTGTEGAILLGGAAPDEPHARLDVDDAGIAYVTGQTASADFPTTTNAFDRVASGPTDAFVARFDLTQSGAASLLYSSYLGGGFNEGGQDITVMDGVAYVTGFTGSEDYPITAGAVQTDIASHAVYRSGDAGSSWQPRSAGLHASGIVQGAVTQAFTVDPGNPERIYYAAGRDTVYLSGDGGVSWSRTFGVLDRGQIFSIAVDPGDSNHVLLGTTEGVFRTNDGGARWEPSSAGLPPDFVGGIATASSLIFDPMDPKRVFAGVTGADTGAVEPPDIPFPLRSVAPAGLSATYPVFRSLDSGGHWEPVAEANADGSTLAMDPTDPDTLYLAGFVGPVLDPEPVVLKTTNGGASWNGVGSIGTGFIIREGFAVDPQSPDTVYAATSDGVYRSTNGGGSWSPVNTGLPLTGQPSSVIDIDSVVVASDSTVFASASSAGVFDTTAGGVFRSTTGGDSWQQVTNGIFADDVTTITTNPTDPNEIFATVEAGEDAFVAAIDTTKSGAASLVSSTYVGGGDQDRPMGIAVSRDGLVAIAGVTQSENLPAANFQDENAGDPDGFLSLLDLSGRIPGDVNCDSVVNSVDPLMILRHGAGLSVTADCLDVGDVNCDGGLNSIDALFVLRFLAALPVDLPDGCPPIGS